MRFPRFGAASLAAAALVVATPGAADEVTKTLRAELSGADVSNFSVENLAGTMRITQGTDGAVSVVVTVHAETQALADVTLRLPRDASFEASASQSSGDMEVGFSGGISTRHDDKLVGDRRGTNGTRIRIETSSGDLEISPR